MVKFFAKLAVSAVLVGWVIGKIDLSQAPMVISALDPLLLSLAFLLNLPGLIFSVWRWQRLLAAQHVRVGSLRLLDSYIVGCFFNVFMPTRVGGDVFRVADLRQASHSLSRSASAVFVERFLGIAVLVLFAACASAVRFPLARKIPAVWIGLGLGMTGAVILLLLLHGSAVDKVLALIPGSVVKGKLARGWKDFQQGVRLLLTDHRALGWGLWYSFLLQLNVVVHYWLIGKSMGFAIPFLDYFFLIPVQLVVLMLPAINGLGIREASCIVLFGFYAVPPIDAAMFGFIDLLMMIVLGAIGGIRFLLRGKGPGVPATAHSSFRESDEKNETSL